MMYSHDPASLKKTKESRQIKGKLFSQLDTILKKMKYEEPPLEPVEFRELRHPDK
jgi:hypothetical protein